ncbi:MAG: hypothetical protein ACE15B_04555 [Bryobacteraceae bacterium]
MRCLVAGMAVLATAQQPSWRDKPAAEWTRAEARQVLTDSPWAKSTLAKLNVTRGGGGGGGGGRIGVGVPRRRTGGIGGYPVPRTPPPAPRQAPAPRKPPTLLVRWETAEPVREAELKTQDSGVPYGDEAHYAVAVLRIPNRLLGNAGKPKAELHRKSGKTIKSTSAKVIPRDQNGMVLFLFPRSKEIVPGDQEIEFRARIGTLEIKQSFSLAEMTWHGKLEL